ncbi:JmjC domain-containing histone demethylation protein 1 [Nakaseomyces bracarensis]|uniref:[histone H3]-dimethyl-L-lysine(36) demethylase n=1 Tax=Nakaseomyces bracarensis TaxID=273131 RepID=A0ABR4NW31_9SACH
MLKLEEKRELEPQDEATKKKRRYNFRRTVQLDYSAMNEGENKVAKFMHPHIEQFNREFEKYVLTGDEGTMSYDDYVDKFETIEVPLRIRDPERSGICIQVEDSAIRSVDKVMQSVGEDHFVNVMDVQSQENERWTMKQWTDYFSKPHDSRDRIRNVISLEVSDIRGLSFNRPSIVDKKDLVDIVWDVHEEKGTNIDIPRPKVTKYCLMSVKDAFTDYHLDFAGTSVYYNLVFGKKRFILYPPTPNNLEKYIEWSTSTYQNSTFLGSQLSDGIAMELNSGDLFMIPAGYIHVVYTPEDSLIFGGNYLTLRDLSKHLKITDVEKEIGIPKKYTFPNIDEVMGRTCEWLIKQALNNNRYDLGKNAITSLVNYVKQGKTKYKPVDFSDKRSMLRQLTDIYSL